MKAIVLCCLLAMVSCAMAAMGQKKFTALDQVKMYAAEHDAKVTVRKWHGNYWVEVDGLDPHGVGKTVDEAAKDFLHCADMMDHEPIDPANSGAPKAPDCAVGQTCI
jgi:hypothetical protein